MGHSSCDFDSLVWRWAAHRSGSRGVRFWVAGVEVGGALVMGPNGLWENRLGPVTASGAHELCHDVHQLRPDMRNPKRRAAVRVRVVQGFLSRVCMHVAACTQIHCSRYASIIQCG